MLQQNSGDNDKPFKLYKYTLTKDDGSRASKKLLTISTLSKDTMLESVAKKFQQKHPDIKVEIKSMSEDRHNINDEGIKKFNAEIMSGKASDLICLDGLPYKKYIDKKIFADISEIISKDSTFDTNQFYNNIIEACKYKGKLYAMPVSFAFGAVQVDKALSDAQGIKLEGDDWTWETFAEDVSKVSGDKNGDGKADIYGLAKTDPLELFEYIFSSRMKQFVDMENKQCRFESKEFIELLKMVKALSSKDIMHSRLDYGALYQESSRGTIGFNFIDDMSTFDYTVSKSMLGDKAEVHAMPLSGGNIPRTFDATMFAINNSSKLKEEAWEFIKFMTLDETFGRNNPVNKNASENMLKEMMKSENSSTLAVSDESGKTRTTVIEPLTSKQYEHIKSVIASLGQLNDYNMQLKAIIEEELKSYLNDQRSAEDVAKLIQNRVNIYLNE
jgi:ABC-type glycerol-3-phosphate transport system substrate-binding protein